MNYWLIKSEADCYSIDQFKKDKKTTWTGVRNYQARNFMRDGMKKGDLVLFYHSSSEPNAVVGIAKVNKEAFPDATQFEKGNEYFDPKATKEKPIWMNPEFQFLKKFKREVTLAEIKTRPDLKGIMLTQPGSRLSVMPVSEQHFKIIEKLGTLN
jgi:predicted RNA-binding protein with PUA-like domain